jgi:hypothetical protein
MFMKPKIISFKEESNSSHVNQGYDQLVAKTDKKNAAESHYDQRKAKKFSIGKTNITQYDLLITAMHIVRATSEETWVHTFQCVNLHPFASMEFPEFCRKIASHLLAGDTFKNDNVDTTAEEMFALLPTFWHGMTPAERKVVMTVCETHAYQYSVACITTLHVECEPALQRLKMSVQLRVRRKWRSRCQLQLMMIPLRTERRWKLTRTVLPRTPIMILILATRMRDANEHDTNLINANVMNNDEPEGRIRSFRLKV